jgi:hypothetical protein
VDHRWMTYVATPQRLQLSLELDRQPGFVLGWMLPLEEASAITPPSSARNYRHPRVSAMVAGSMDDAIRRGGPGEAVGKECRAYQRAVPAMVPAKTIYNPNNHLRAVGDS